MQKFLSRFGHLVTGVISGFDRLVLRGYIPRLAYPQGLEGFLAFRDICRKDFGDRAQHWTKLVKELSLGPAEELGIPVQHLISRAIRKEEVAKRYLQESDSDGPVCVLTAVEPCSIWNVHRSREKKRIVFDRRQGRCLHLYHYFNDPEFGLIHVRIQTWMPYDIQVYVNGREWLARQMKRAGMVFTKADNCFPSIEDVPQAQKLMDKLLKMRWQSWLDQLAQRVNPALEQILGGFQAAYYWTAYQTEWATDVMFKDPDELTRLMPLFTRHSMENLHSDDVFHFLGKKLHGNFLGEVLSKFRRRPEGVCIKFLADRNSLKMYQKLLSILRIEATINAPKFFPVMRTASGQGEESKKLRPLRKSICDLGLRANVSQASNKRVMNSLAVVVDSTSVKDLLDPITKPTILNGRRVRAIQPWSQTDLNLISAVAHGQFLQQGFRNRDLVPHLFPEPTDDPSERKRRSARVSRLLRIFRAHAIIEKVAHSHRYLVTKRGAAIIAAILGVRETPVSALRPAA